MREDNGFAAAMDQAHPDLRHPANQTGPSNRAVPAEKAKGAAPDSSVSDQPAQEGATATANEAAPASNEETSVLGSNVVIPAVGSEPETALTAIDAVDTESVNNDVAVPTQVAAPPPPAVVPAGATLVTPAIDITAQAGTGTPLPDSIAATPSQPVSTAPTSPVLSDEASPVAAFPTPATPAPAHPEQPVGANPVAPAQVGSSAAAAPLMATGEAQKQLAEADPAKSEIVDTNAEAATPADAPKQPKPVGMQSDASSPSVQPRPDMSPDKPGEQPDALIKTDDPALMTKPNIDPSGQVTQLAAPALAASTHTATPHASPVSTAQPVPVDAVAVEIAAQARAGNSRFEIRLDPPELGRIDVRLDVDREGNVKSRLVIERADTYDLLRRDQSTLERALQQAGLKTSDNALEFSLRDHGFAQQRDADDQSRRTHAMIHEAEVAPSEAANGYARLLGARGGIDIRV